MTAPVILVEAHPRRVSDGAAQAVRLAGGGAVQPFHYLGEHWQAGLEALPTIVTSLEFEGEDLGTGGLPQAAEIDWSAARQGDLDALAALFWQDAPVDVRIGPEGADPPIALTGKVLEATAEPGRLRLALADPAADLKKPLLTARYAGTGGIEGPAEWDGTLRRRVWGRVWNLKGDPIDPANDIYCFADPLRPILAFDALRDSGAEAAAVTVLGWQGSAGATFAALQAAAAPAGGGVACPAIACVKWWTQPAGDLTADLRGETGAGYVETSAEIAQRLVQEIGGPGFAAGAVAWAAGARPAPAGWVAKDESTTAAQMIEALLGQVSLLWMLDTSGTIRIREWAWPQAGNASAAAAVSQQVTRKRAFRPVVTRKLGYRRNELPMARGDLAGIVLASDVQLAGGGDLEAEVASALSLARSKGRVTVGDTLPDVASSSAGDTHVGSDGTFYQRVNEGGVLLGGFVVTLGGYRPRLAWTPWSEQPLRDGLAELRRDLGDLDVSVDRLIGLADDGVISAYEKTTLLIPEETKLETRWSALSSLAAGLGVSTTAVAAARANWNGFLAGLSPAWNDASQDSPVDRAGYDAARDGFDAALAELDKAIAASAAQTAVYSLVSGTPSSLAGINASEGGKLSGIAPGATVGAPLGTPVGSISAGDVSATINFGGGVANNKVLGPAIVPYEVTATSIAVASYFDVAADQTVDNPTLALNATGSSAVRVDVSFSSYRTAGSGLMTAAIIRIVGGVETQLRIGGATTTSPTTTPPTSFFFVDYPPAGTVEYRLRFYASSAAGNQFRVGNSALAAIQLKNG